MERGTKGAPTHQHLDAGLIIIIPKIMMGCSGGPQGDPKTRINFQRAAEKEEKKGKARRRGNFKQQFRLQETKHGRGRLSIGGPQTRGVRKSNVQRAPKLRGSPARAVKNCESKESKYSGGPLIEKKKKELVGGPCEDHYKH